MEFQLMIRVATLLIILNNIYLQIGKECSKEKLNNS